MYHRMKHAARLFVILIVLLAPTTVRARPALDFFLPPQLELTTGASDGAAAWADIDNDDDLDLVIAGLGNSTSSGYTRRTILFENNGILLAETASGKPDDTNYPGFEKVEFSSADWADYNSDGYLDMLLTGQYRYGGVPAQPQATSRVYYNSSYVDNGVTKRYFIDSKAGLPGVYRGRATWGDYDNDGRPDILLTGYQPGPTSDTPFAALYHNNGGTISKASITLPALGDSYAAWGDYNRDGTLDFALMGKNAAGNPVTAIFRNQGNSTFTTISLPGQSLGQLAWADIDKDGDLDLLVSGSVSSGALSHAELRALSGRSADGTRVPALAAAADPVPATHLYRDNNGVFTEVANTGLPDLSSSVMAFGDYDNDGDPDLLLNGRVGQYPYTDLWINDGTGHFTKPSLSVKLGADFNLSMAWGDFDKDASLDALITGVRNNSDFYTTNVYINDPAVENGLPAAPGPVSGAHYAACWAPDTSGNPTGGRVVLRWTAPSGDSTPPAVMTYNVRVGSTPGGAEILRPAANLVPNVPSNGFNHLAEAGNAAYRPSGNGSTAAGGVTLTGLSGSTTYYWAVSAVDAAYAGGPFSAEQAFNPNGDITTPDDQKTMEETAITVNVTGNDQSKAGAVTAFAVDPPTHGTAVLDSQKRVVYTPALNYSGDNTVTYYAIDPAGKCNISTLTVHVSNTPDAPALLWKDASGRLLPGPAALRTNQGAPITLTLVGTDPDAGDKLTWTIFDKPQHGTASLVTPSPTGSGAPVTIRYAPASAYTGMDTFTVRVTDSTGRTAELAVKVSIERYRIILPWIGK